MAEPVRADVDQLELSPRPVLGIVPEPPAERHSVGRSAAAGALLGFVVAGALITAVAMSRDVDAPAALALGAFVAAFGGAGFGCMVGGVLALARNGELGERERGDR